MENNEIIIQKLNSIEQKLEEQNLLKKEILNFNETCAYLAISASHLYKMTSSKSIPHFCPQGKKLYFKRAELDVWLQRNRKSTADEIEQAAADYLIRNKRR
jgi:excisionase family DNA binding protein